MITTAEIRKQFSRGDYSHSGILLDRLKKMEAELDKAEDAYNQAVLNGVLFEKRAEAQVRMQKTVSVDMDESYSKRIKELEADVNALDFSWEEAKQRWHKAEAKLEAMDYAETTLKEEQGE